MPNIATILKEEIVRLARKELKKELEGLKKAVASHRSEIASAKKRLLALEKQAARLVKAAPKPKVDPETASKLRFNVKGFATKRQKLGLSAEAMGQLLGVSAQTIYNWESGKTRPKKAQIEAIAGVRKMGKREVNARLTKPEE